MLHLPHQSRGHTAAGEARREEPETRACGRGGGGCIQKVRGALSLSTQLLLVVRQPKNEHRDVWERNWVKNQLVRQPKSEPREVWEYISSAGTYLNIQGVCDQLFLYQVINLTNHCQPFIHRVIECPHIRGPVGMTQSPFEGKEARKHLA